MNRAVLVGTAVLAMAAMPAFAANSGKAIPDQAFVKAAAQGGMAEVELGKLASEKTSNPQVKEFGEKMVADHSKANDELKSIAQNKNITLPSELSSKDKALRDRLAKLSGASFDRAYMKAMVSDHVKDVDEFRKEARTAKDPDIRSFASNTLPTLEDHLKMARMTDQAVVGTSGKK